jgi:hypothetical protein
VRKNENEKAGCRRLFFFLRRRRRAPLALRQRLPPLASLSCISTDEGNSKTIESKSKSSEGTVSSIHPSLSLQSKEATESKKERLGTCDNTRQLRPPAPLPSSPPSRPPRKYNLNPWNPHRETSKSPRTRPPYSSSPSQRLQDRPLQPQRTTTRSYSPRSAPSQCSRFDEVSAALHEVDSSCSCSRS